MSAPSFFESRDGLRLAYRDDGPDGAEQTGHPVLCLAGLTRNMADFDDLAALLGDRRVVRLDARGRGASDHDPNHLNYAVPVEAMDALTLLDHLGIPKAVVVGTSRGGLQAMVIAASAKDRLAGVVLNDVGPVVDPKGIEAIMRYVGVDPGHADFDAAAAAHERALGPDFPDVDRATWRRFAERIYVERDGKLALSYDPKIRDALIAQAEAQEAPPDLWPLFESLDGVPTLVIRGANSNILSAETAAEMKRRLPDIGLVEIPNRGHAPFLDEPAAAVAIRALLARADRQ